MRGVADSYEIQAKENEYVASIKRVNYWNKLNRPFMLLKPNVTKDGDQWCALLGPNIQEGVCGFGYTPEEAGRAVDRAWLYGH